VIHELTALLEHPYSDTPAVPTPHADTAATEAATTANANACARTLTAADKWYSKTPDWARNLPGVAFMS
jgi:hypothetical protein